MEEHEKLLTDTFDKIVALWEENKFDKALKEAVEIAKKLPYAPEPELWAGDLLFETEDWDASLEHYRKALEIEPELVEAMTGVAKILYEKCQFADAGQYIIEALKLDPESGEANYYKGLLLERAGDFKNADRFLEKAHGSDPDYYPSTFAVPRKKFDRLVEAEIEAITPKVRDYLKNVAIITEDIPTEGDLLAENPPLSPHILGLFRGTAAPHVSIESPWSQLPNQIVLFKRNLEHFSQDPEELAEQIKITLLHEVGHFLGLDEGDLEKRGLD